MLNDPPPQSAPHTSRPPATPPADDSAGAQTSGAAGGAAKRTRVTLHIPAVRPVVTYALLLLLTGVYALTNLNDSARQTVFEFAALNRPLIVLQGEYHRLLTAALLHSNLVHLLFNLLTLYLFGSSMERIFGHLRFGLIFLLGGMAGSVVSAIVSPPEMLASSASAALCAVLAAEFVYLLKHRTLLGRQGWRRRWWVVIFTTLTLAVALVSSLNTPLAPENWANLGGLAGGMILARYIAPVFNLKRHPVYADALTTEDINPLRARWEPVSAYIAALIGILIVATAILRPYG